MKLGALLATSQSSAFPNATETYKCKFDKFDKLVLPDGREFTLLLVSATDTKDKTQNFSTIVQKMVDVPDEIRNEVFTIETIENPDKKYCKVVFVED